MRVWIDLTNSPARARHAAGDRGAARARRTRSRVTARDFAQTLGAVRALRDRAHGRSAATAAGGSAAKARRASLDALARRSRAGRAGGASTSRSATAPTTSRSPRGCCAIPSSTTFDYEWARVQHTVNCRLAQARRRARRDPARAARAATARRRPSCARYPGLKEEYYLADFEPDAGGARRARRSTAARPLAVVRTPPEVSLYHRFENPLFARVLERLRGASAQAVVLPRTPEQRAELAARRRLHRPRAGDRRAVADRLRRPRDLGRRHDEPRGGRARHARLHDLRGPPRRGRRAA